MMPPFHHSLATRVSDLELPEVLEWTDVVKGPKMRKTSHPHRRSRTFKGLGLHTEQLG